MKKFKKEDKVSQGDKIKFKENREMLEAFFKGKKQGKESRSCEKADTQSASKNNILKCQLP